MIWIWIAGALIWTAISFSAGMDTERHKDETREEIAWQHGYNSGWEDCEKKNNEMKEKKKHEEV